MKFSYDIHGVLDDDPETFAVLTKTLVDAGHELHVVTGITASVAEEQLKKLNITYTHLFSITDYHVAKGTPIEWRGTHPHMDSWTWDKTKADYCQEHGINLHTDDSDVYLYFFKTPYARYYRRNSKRVRKME